MHYILHMLDIDTHMHMQERGRSRGKVGERVLDRERIVEKEL